MRGKGLRSCDLTTNFCFKCEPTSIFHNNCSLPSEYHWLLLVSFGRVLLAKRFEVFEGACYVRRSHGARAARHKPGM